MLSLSQLSRESGYSTAFIRQKVKDGSLPHTRRGNLYYVKLEDWTEFIEKHRKRKVE